ncbi:isocyanide synthase family protein [Streptomyces sp. NPDC000410]|uniref:isocyanide synthase family protein n=1 Tax=Streptomyces sp. NPDC000410 TaxID=3154254 RepID=UPI003329BE74
MSADTERTCHALLRLLLPHRRPVGSPGPTAEVYGHTPEACFPEQLDVLRAFVRADAPILLTLPAFPCKSPNPAKVTGALPDLGELLSLRFLDDLCARIADLHPPGARLLICSDGHVFGDLVGVSDQRVDAYAVALRRMIADNGLRHLDTFGLDAVWGSLGYDRKRALLEREFAEPMEILREEVRSGGPALAHYRGMIRFLVEDTYDWTGSKAQLQQDCRRRAYGVLRRSRAWANLIAQHHPGSLRLSIHPQPCGSPKFGISLLEAEDNWLTPWHSVVVQTGTNRFRLMKRREAERVAIPAGPSANPSHYIAAEAPDTMPAPRADLRLAPGRA